MSTAVKVNFSTSYKYPANRIVRNVLPQNNTTNTRNNFYYNVNNINHPAYDLTKMVAPVIRCLVTCAKGSDSIMLLNIDSLRKLDSLAKLPDNWNENGASRFSVRLIQECKKILSSLPIQPEIFPTAGNTIQMEYEKNNGEYLEFNISEDKISVFSIDSIENETEEELCISDYNKIKQIVSRFYE